MTYNVFGGTLNPTLLIYDSLLNHLNEFNKTETITDSKRMNIGLRIRIVLTTLLKLEGTHRIQTRCCQTTVH